MPPFKKIGNKIEKHVDKGMEKVEEGIEKVGKQIESHVDKGMDKVEKGIGHVEKGIKKVGKGIGKVEKEVEKKVIWTKEFVKRYKWWIISGAVTLLLIIIITGGQLLLYLNFLVGNDLVVTLNADKESLILLNGESEKVNFEAGVTANLFCKATCTSVFSDISKGIIIEQDKANIRPGLPLKKTYTIKADEPGEGQILYRFSISCQGVETTFCHTSEETKKRSILITMNHKIDSVEENIKKNLSIELPLVIKEVKELRDEELKTLAKKEALNKITIIEERDYDKEDVEMLIKDLEKIKDFWSEQSFSNAQVQMENLKRKIEDQRMQVNEEKKFTDKLIESYTLLQLRISESRSIMENWGVIPYKEEDTAMVQDKEDEFNTIIRYLNDKRPFENKVVLVQDLLVNVKKADEQISKTWSKDMLQKGINSDTFLDTWCFTKGVCIPHQSIKERAENALNETGICNEILLIRERWNSEYKKNTSENVSYEDASPELNAFFQNIGYQYMIDLPQNATHTLLLKEILPQTNVQINVSNETLFKNLEGALPLECLGKQRKYLTLENSTLAQLEIANITLPPWTIAFEEPFQKCCIFGKCAECCTENSCKTNESLYPIVFLHGHAFNKDLSAEYSLDAFNEIQAKLEQDNYLNAGSISVYTGKNTIPGLWGYTRVPLTIKASYYFDVFEDAQSPRVVQTKSESIDTYAVRLKELIDTIKYKTGKDKVIIMAHSMGGLVGRRYLQIFGEESVSKLILITVPNHGIEEDTASYCFLVGEGLECRDMGSDSLFINKIERAPPLSIPVTNIIGIGCPGALEDGVVSNKSAWLEGATNFEIPGTCTSLEPLHTDILHVSKYPEVYAIIKEALRTKMNKTNVTI